jgi:hypothetical protein
MFMEDSSPRTLSEFKLSYMHVRPSVLRVREFEPNIPPPRH